MAVDKPRAMAAIREFLLAVGEDPDRPGLIETPDRVARAAQEVLGGYDEDPAHHLRKQFKENDNEEMVIVRDIPFSSLCEHHILPFTGKAHVAYIPRAGRITGLSKIGRCVNGYARRLQLQERLTAQIADAMMVELDPQGVLVVLEAEHMCMTMRGVQKPGTKTVTLARRGVFESDPALEERFFRMLRA